MSHQVRLCALAVGVLAGCATPYSNEAESSITGGGFRTQGPGRMMKVGFYGNGYIDAETVTQYARFRAAEYAQASGKPYFLLYEDLYHAAAEQTADRPTVGIVGGKPSAYAFVLLLDEDERGAWSTEAVLEERTAFLASEEVAKKAAAKKAREESRKRAEKGGYK